MIGDTMETDILGGAQLGFHTVLVLSGGTKAEDLPRYAYRPDVVVPSIAELADMMDVCDWCPPWRTTPAKAAPSSMVFSSTTFEDLPVAAMSTKQ